MWRILRLGAVNLRCPGKQDHYARAPAGFAFEVDESLIRSDDAAHRRQSQAGAFAGILGGKERFKQALAGFRVHTLTVVAHDEQHAWKCGKRPSLYGARHRFESAITGLDGN